MKIWYCLHIPRAAVTQTSKISVELTYTLCTFPSKMQRPSVCPLAWPSLTPTNKTVVCDWCGELNDLQSILTLVGVLLSSLWLNFGYIIPNAVESMRMVIFNLNIFSSCWHDPFLKKYTSYFSPFYILL